LNSTLKAHLGLLGTNLFFATNYSAIKYFTSHHYAGPLGINIIRVGVSLVLFWLLFLFKRPEKRIEKKDIPALILCTLTAIALNQLLFIEGLSFTFPIHAALLTLITPILITIIAARILNERVTVAKLAGLSLGAFGAVLLVTQREITAPGENVVLGDILVILSAVAYTFYFILVKPLMNKYSAVQMIRWIFTIGFIMTFPFCFTQFSHITWNVFTFKDWFFLFLVVVPGTFLAYVFNVYGIQKLSASKAGAYIYSQPVFAVVIAVIFLKESLSIYKIIAGVLIFAGVFLSNKKHN
jgi:drug/metabolite transporter (DMT)-like permease